MRRRGARPVRRAARGNGPVETPAPRPGPTPTTSTSAWRSTSCACWCIIGVRADGRKELVALADGYRESTESWADLLRDCARRGMRAPVLAVGDGALGFWGALREVFPPGREQRCWFHKIANVLGALPKSAHPGAKKALAEIWNAEDRRHALDAVASVQGRLRGEVRQGRREDHRRSRRAARVLRLPGRALDPPADHEPDRVAPSPPSGTAPRSPAARAHAPPGWRWRSS